MQVLIVCLRSPGPIVYHKRPDIATARILPFRRLHVLHSDGQADGDRAAAAGGVADVQRSVVAVDDLIADGEADAGAPGLGGALVEFIFNVGQLVLRHAGAVIPDADHHMVLLPAHGHQIGRASCRERV